MSSSKSSMSTISSFQSSEVPGLSSNIDEGRWVVYVRQILEEPEEHTEIQVSIFCVPKTLMLSDPDSYIPQVVAIGPYHSFRAELYDMEKYKLAAAKRNQRELPNKKLQDLVDQFLKLELEIRAFYHKPLNFSGETLAWMMAVDASFLFEFLQVCAVGAGQELTNVPSRVLSHLIELASKKAANNAIFRDIIMLENQIPLFVLRELLELQFSSLKYADDWLLSMLIGFSKELSPFKMVEESPKVQVKDRAHLLDFAYHVIVPNLEEQSHDHITEIKEDVELKEGDKESFAGEPSQVRQFLDKVWNIISNLGKGLAEWIKRKILILKPIKVIVNLPRIIISKIPVLKKLKEPLEQVFSALHIGGQKKEGKDSDSKDNTEKPPLIEEITIPSVIDLFEVGVRFVPTNEGIQSIAFDIRTATLYLPVISVDVNSEIVLRNMVAYEACRVPGPLILTRYTELMNGIIDNENDAKFLRERGIIINRLKSDKEVADLWNGMSNSIRLTKVSFIDKVIEDVNKYYNGRWKIKFGKFMKKYVFGSWQLLTFFAGIMLLLLMCLQAFCQVYSCGRILHIKGLEPAVTG